MILFSTCFRWGLFVCLVLLLSYLTNTITTNFNIKKTRKKTAFWASEWADSKKKDETKVCLLLGFEVVPRRPSYLNTHSHIQMADPEVLKGDSLWLPLSSLSLALFHTHTHKQIKTGKSNWSRKLSGGLDAHILRDHGMGQLWQDVFLHHSLCEVLTVVCQAAQSQSCRMLDTGDNIKQQGAQQGHHTCRKTEVRRGGGRSTAGLDSCLFIAHFVPERGNQQMLRLNHRSTFKLDILFNIMF